MGRILRSIIISYTISVLLPAAATAQFYEYGQDAGSVRWNQFSSQHYKLIYPRGLDSLAMSFADRLEYYYPFQAEVLDFEHKKLPVVVHNESSFSNGVFVWAPKRLEIFTNPNPNGYPQDWLTQLAIHEGRHAVQVSKLNQGFSKGLSILAGEQAVGAITGFLPVWYLEGDAVDAETRFSQTGRGRLPSFEMGIKAQILEEKKYSYTKALLGSYKDYVPNHYELGYLLVRHGRRKYGDGFWNDMEEYAARKPFLLAPAYFSMKKYGIKSKRSLYNNALREYRYHWVNTRLSREISTATSWSRNRNNIYTNYHFPQWLSDSKLLVLKTGIDQIPEFIVLDSTGREKRVFRPGYMNSDRFSLNDQYLVWDELVPDKRWSNRNYSVIRAYDLETGRARFLGRKTRYYAPSLSKSGDMIAAIEQNTDQTFNLVILDKKGKVLRKVNSPENEYIQHPTWMEGDSAVLLTLSDSEGEFLFSYTLKDNKWKRVFHAGFNDISHPVVRNSEVYFSSTFSGIDNIFCYNLMNKRLEMVTSSEFGAFEPSLSHSGDFITYADYHADGYRAVTAEIKRDSWIPEQDFPERVEQLDFLPTESEKIVFNGEDSIEAGSYNPSRYHKIFNTIHPHSWLPLYFDYFHPEAALSAESLPVNPGFTLLSQNLLSTVTGMIGYEYRYSEKLHYFHTGATLKGRYPIVDLRLDYGGYPAFYPKEQGDSVALSPDRMNFSSSMYVPMRLNTGKFITFLQPGIGWNYSSDVFYNDDLSYYRSGNHRFNYRFYFTSYLRTSRKDIIPRFGIVLSAYYQHAPFDQFNLGSIYNYSANVYLPGILKHQSLKLSYAHQVQDPIRYLYGNTIRIPRGMQRLGGLNLDVYSADYTLPVLYPDLSLEPFIYIKRIRGNIWGDYLVGRDVLTGDPDNPVGDQVHYTYGIDLLADFHPMRMYFPFSMGARIIYLPGTAEIKVEMLFNIDIN